MSAPATASEPEAGATAAARADDPAATLRDLRRLVFVAR